MKHASTRALFLVLSLAAVCASSAHAQVRREGLGMCDDVSELVALTDGARVVIDEGIDDLSGPLVVRHGDLFYCPTTCVRLGPVDYARWIWSERDVRVEVASSSRSSWLETWVVEPRRGGTFVHAIETRPRRALDRRWDPGHPARAGRSIDRTWRASDDAETSAVLARVGPVLTHVGVQGVRVTGGWLGLVTTSETGGALVAFLRRDGGAVSSTCAIGYHAVASSSLSDVVQVAPFGDELGAVFLRVEGERQGYSYDQGWGTQLWAFVPRPGGRLAFSSVAIADWHGRDGEDDLQHWTGWAVPLQTLGVDALRLGRPRRWTARVSQDEDRVYVGASAPAEPEDRALLLRLDDEGLVEPD